MTAPVTIGSRVFGLVSEIVIARVTRLLADGKDPIWEICEPGAGTYGMPETWISSRLLKELKVEDLPEDFPFVQGSVVRVNLGYEMTAKPGPDEARSEALFVVTGWSTTANPDPSFPPTGDPEWAGWVIVHCIPISVGRGSRGEQYGWDAHALLLVSSPAP